MKKSLLSIGLFIIMITILSGCQDADRIYEKGKNSFDNGNYEEAANSFAEVIKHNPYKANYYIDYAMALTALAKYDEAMIQFDLAFMDKDIYIVKKNNKRIYRGKGIAYYKQQKYNQAIEQFQKAIALNELTELNADILYYMGDAQKIVGAYQDAIDTYTSLLLTEQKASAYNSRAICYHNLGKYEKSLEDYNKAIELDPMDYASYIGKYYLLMDQEDTNGANEVLNQALKLEIVTDEDKYNLAKIHYLMGDYEQALSGLSEGFTNGFNEAYYYIAEIFRLQKDYKKAIYYYETFIQKGDGITSNVYNQIASCLIKTGEFSDAIAYLEQGIALNQATSMQTLKKNEIIAYESLGKFEVANEKLQEYLKSYPEDKEAKREAMFIKTRLMEAVTEGAIE